jgi:eukaryotic-like serine/threonine-protein kinase
MTPSRRPKEPLPVPLLAGLRCLACGRRIAGPCPSHGAPELADRPSEPPPADTIVPPRIPGHRVRRVIACGGFGVVFDGERMGDGRRVAIKIAREDRGDARACVEREIAVLTRIGAPHVPAVLAHGRTEAGTPYVVMEHIAAPTLAARLVDRPAPPSIGETTAITIAILDALSHVHACGYVHRDVKPENIFVSDSGQVRLVDFGLAVRMDGAGAVFDATREGEAVGTAEYMAPEQCEGLINVDGRADLYAVGVILFELLAGRPPFWGPRAVVKESHLSRRPPRVSALSGGREIPTALEDVIACCLAKDRGKRFGTAAELRAAIEAARDEGEATSATGARAPSASAPEPRGGHVTAGLLFFETALDVATVKARLGALSGQIGQAIGGRCVAVFTDDADENPARRAHRAAEELLRLGVTARARVDVAPVAVRTRRDGVRLFVSPLFSRASRFPGGADPEGVTITPDAAVVLPEALDLCPSSFARPGSGAPPMLGVEDSPLVGRDALLASLVEGARRAVAEVAPTIVSIVADAGHGKSHLSRALRDRLAALGPRVRVLSLRARAPSLGDVDPTLAALLGSAFDLPAAPPPESAGVALLRQRLGLRGGEDLAPAVALALGWIAPGMDMDVDGDSSLTRTSLHARQAAPGALRAALIVAVGDALRRLAAERPLLVIVDDAHLGGSVVLSALEYAALAEARAPLWICALGRPLLRRERPAWGQNAARHEHVELGPLDPESAATLCRQLLLPVESAPGSAVQRLVERAQGSPLLLVELVRGLHRDGVVRKTPKGEAFYLATDEIDHLPDSPLITWIARREIDALEPALRSHARLIALLGEDVRVGEIEGLLRQLERQGGDREFPLDAAIGTRRLLAAELLAEDDAGHVNYRNALVREAVARAVPRTQRERIHAAAASYYEGGAAGIGEERRRAQLAYHAGESGMAAVAARAYRELAERSRARHAYTDAERLYSRAIENENASDADPSLRAADLRGRGAMRYRTARYHDALADLGLARDLAVELGDARAEAEILLDEATVLDWMAEYERSEERVAAAAAIVPRLNAPLLDARLLLGRGRALHRGSRNEAAAELLEAAAAAAARLGLEGYETQVIARILLGFILPGLGRLVEAGRALDRTIALCEAHGDHVHLAAALNNRGLLWGYRDDERRMIADLDRTVALARELGQATLELVGQFNAGEYLLLMDAADAAEPRVRRAVAIDRRLSGDPGRPEVTLLLALLHLHTGDAAAARDLAAEVRARQEEATAAGSPSSADARFAPSEDVLCAMIELATREASAAAWDDLEARSERFSVGQERIMVVEARAVATARCGRQEDALCALSRALDLASRIPNAMARRLRRRAAEIAAR